MRVIKPFRYARSLTLAGVWLEYAPVQVRKPGNPLLFSFVQEKQGSGESLCSMGLESATKEAAAQQAAVSCKAVANPVPQKRFRGVTKHRRSGRSVSCACLGDTQLAYVIFPWHNMY